MLIPREEIFVLFMFWYCDEIYISACITELICNITAYYRFFIVCWHHNQWKDKYIGRYRNTLKSGRLKLYHSSQLIHCFRVFLFHVLQIRKPDRTLQPYTKCRLKNVKPHNLVIKRSNNKVIFIVIRNTTQCIK